MAIQPLPDDAEVVPIDPNQRQGSIKPLPPGTEVTPIRPDLTGREPYSLSPPSSGSVIGDIGRGTTDVLTGFLDIPGNVTKWGFRMMGLDIGPPDTIRRDAAAIGIANEPGKEPKTIGTDIGKLTGSTLIGLAPVIGPGSRMLAAEGTAASIPAKTLTGQIVRETARTAITKPGRFAALEAGGIYGAAAAGNITEQDFPDSPARRAIAEITGGVLGSASVAGLQRAARLSLYTPTAALIRAVRSNIKGPDPADVNAMAGNMLRGVVNKDAALRGLSDPNILPEIPLTPAQRSGEPGALALERNIMQTTQELKGIRDQQISTVNKSLRNAFQPSTGTTAPATAEDTRNYLSTLVDTRLRIAAQKADDQLKVLGPGITREQSNLVAREELDKALTAAREQERELWSRIPMDEKRGTSALQDAYGQIKANTARAQTDDIPSIAKTLLEGDKGLGQETTVREILGLRSQMLETARIARAGGRYNQARIADQLAEAALTDLGAVRGGPTGSIRTAMDFSRDLNDRFTRGAVGRVLGYESTGGVSTPPGMTLEMTAGRVGARGREEADALLKASDTPALRGSITDYLKNDFQKSVVREGRVDPELATAYLRNRAEILSRFPDLKGQMETAAKSAGQWKAATSDPDINAANIWIKAPAEGEINAALKQVNPQAGMGRIMALARQDTTGQAEKGVKAAFSDFLMESATSSTRDASGTRFIDGAKLAETLQSPRVQKAMSVVFNEGERTRFAQIAATARRMDLARGSGTAEIPEDQANYLTRTLAGILGAKAGRALNTGTIQAPGRVAALFEKVLTGGQRDAAQKLLREAIRDPELFRAMLVPPGSPQFAAAKARINGWATGILIREGHEWGEQ